MFLFSHCEKPAERRTINTGSPLTILAPQSETSPETIEWYYAVRPLKSKISLNTSFESARFTPDYPGNYDIVAELYNDKNEIFHFKVFQYYAIGPTYLEYNNVDDIKKNIEEVIIDSSKIDTLIASPQFDTLKLSMDNDTVVEMEIIQIEVKKKVIIAKTQYTIQVFSLPDEQQANVKLDLLKNAGFESYILPFIHPEFNLTWYRVRVGKYVEYSDAELTSNLIKQKLNIETWIDRLK